MSTAFSERINRVRHSLGDWQVEGLLVTNITNCTWLSGFTGSSAALLITADRAILATDSRYWEQAAAQAPDYELFKHSRLPQDTAVLLRSAGIDTAGIEANHVTLQQARELELIAGITWRHLERPVEPLRRRKIEEEIAAIRAAAAITDTAMAQLPSLIGTGISERELAWRLERYMRDMGAGSMSFPPIVAFGPNSALPHHAPGDRELQIGDIVLVDMGARLNGYNSDLTRTFLYADELDEQFQEIYDAVLEAQVTAIRGIEPGIDTKGAHLLAADSISAAGYGDAFSHGLGHGLGLEVHEDPYLSALRPPEELDQGMVITIEPGIYLPGWGGVRIEDLMLITENGTDYLSHCPKQRLLFAP